MGPGGGKRVFLEDEGGKTWSLVGVGWVWFIFLPVFSQMESNNLKYRYIGFRIYRVLAV